MSTATVFDMPLSDYLSTRALSKSGAAELLRSPRHLAAARNRESTPALDFGSLVHCMALEPSLVDKRFARRLDLPRRSNADKERHQEHERKHAGKTLLCADDWDRATQCVDAIYSHPAARKILADGFAEVSIFWDHEAYPDVPCKARPDWLTTRGIAADLKTCRDASPEAFARDCARYGYHAQHAHAIAGLRAAAHDVSTLIFIAVESEPPHGVAVYELDAEAIEAGHLYMDRAARAWSAAAAADFTAGYPSTIQSLSLPRWATYKETSDE